jgi:YesN/AraC family two-component response regulator
MLKKMRVLIADDSPLILDRLQEILRDCAGAEIVASLENGKDALEAIRSLKPDLVILDINMPGMTGLQVLDAVKKEKYKTKFILLTFYASNYFRKKAFSLGTDYFLSKVDDFEKVSVVVNKLLVEEDENSVLINLKQVR